jgi:general secretion pathway protein K
VSLAWPRGARGTQRGFALFVVLWFLVLLAAIGSYMLAASRMQTALARNIIAAAKAEALADAGVSDAVFRLTETNDKAQWQPDGSVHTLALPTGTLAIRISDESDKMNVNLASAAQLQGLLQALGVDADQAKTVATAIGTWVGTVKTTNTAENPADQYHDAGLRYEPPRAPAATLEELRFVLGMTPQLFAQMSPYATVYTNAAAPDPRTAPPIIQQALAFAAAIQPVGSQAPPASPPPAAAQPAAAAAPAPGADTLTQPAAGAGQRSSVVASVDVVAHSREGGVFARHAVIRLAPNNPKGYVVLDWQRVDADQ